MAALAMASLEPVTGDPERLIQAAGRYTQMAEQIRELTARLTEISQDGQAVGDAADAFRTRAHDLSELIGQAVPRYETAQAAVREYAVVLQDAQVESVQVGRDAEVEQQALYGLYAERDELDQQVFRAQALASPELEELEWRRRVVQESVTEHEQRLGTLLTQHAQVHDTVDTAGHAAAEQIDSALERLDDGVLDVVADFLAPVGEFLAKVDEWIKEVLEQVVLVLTLLVTIAVVVVALVLTVVSVPAIFIGLKFLELLGFDVPSIDFSADLILDTTIAASLALLPALNFWLHETIRMEAERPTPEMRLVETKVDCAGDLDPYEHAFAEASAIDAVGRRALTRVQIIDVGVDEDGQRIWRVVLPSTQDWEVPFGDAPAANDLGSNLQLMLAPELPAAYERMVIDAMRQAGIGPDDHVMMVGFSQGGIGSGKIAADDDLPFNIEAIAVAGAPIDHMDIPADVNVLSFQHTGDPVHRTDGQPPAPPRDNWVTISTDPYTPGGPQQHPGIFVDIGQHEAREYARTAQLLGDGSLGAEGYITADVEQAARQVRAAQSKFFSDTETSYYYEGSE